MTREVWEWDLELTNEERIEVRDHLGIEIVSDHSPAEAGVCARTEGGKKKN